MITLNQKVHGIIEGPFVNAHMANFSHSCLSRCWYITVFFLFSQFASSYVCAFNFQLYVMATKMTTMMIVMMIELKKEERIWPDRVAASNT